MANRYWDYLTSLVSGTRARSKKLNNDFSGIESGLDAIETEVDACLRLTSSPGTTQITGNAAARSLTTVGFDSAGDVKLFDDTTSSTLAAAASAVLSQGYANTAEDTPVPGGAGPTDFSALHWAAKASALGGRMIDRKVYTSSGTWTKPTGIAYAIVTAVGGGGGGAGVAGAGAAVKIGGSGGGGGAIKAKILAADLTATEVVTIGSGGTAGAAGDNNGGTGGSSSFGTAGDTTKITASGGAFGTAAPGDNTSGPGGLGGTPSAESSFLDAISVDGQRGGVGTIVSTVSAIDGSGGDSGLGFGSGDPGVFAAASGGVVGRAGTGYGSGTSGTKVLTSTGNSAGVAGKSGIVIVESYN